MGQQKKEIIEEIAKGYMCPYCGKDRKKFESKEFGHYCSRDCFNEDNR